MKEYQTAVEKGRGNLPWPKPLRGSIGAVADKQLAALLESGIAFHHAGLDNLDRRAVEDAFIKGTISIVCECLISFLAWVQIAHHPCARRDVHVSSRSQSSCPYGEDLPFLSEAFFLIFSILRQVIIKGTKFVRAGPA